MKRFVKAVVVVTAMIVPMAFGAVAGARERCGYVTKYHYQYEYQWQCNAWGCGYQYVWVNVPVQVYECTDVPEYVCEDRQVTHYDGYGNAYVEWETQCRWE